MKDRLRKPRVPKPKGAKPRNKMKKTGMPGKRTKVPDRFL